MKRNRTCKDSLSIMATIEFLPQDQPIRYFKEAVQHWRKPQGFVKRCKLTLVVLLKILKQW